MEITLNQKIEGAKKLIKEYAEKYPNYSIGFSGGKDSVVVAHLAMEVLGTPKMFAVLSDTEFSETYNYVSEFISVSKMKVFKYENGDNPADCCRSEKVKRFKEAVKNLDCWFSGIRNDEGITRGDFKEVEERDGLVKVNPILHFTEKDIWRYLATRHLKLNPKYKDGYRSLSCSKCSVVEEDGAEDERAGRWKGTKHEGCECGIHTESLRS